MIALDVVDERCSEARVVRARTGRIAAIERAKEALRLVVAIVVRGQIAEQVQCGRRAARVRPVGLRHRAESAPRLGAVAA